MEFQKLHFVLLPLMAQGHMIPMIDIARLLAKRGVIVSIITTPLNAKRFDSVINRATESGLQIHVFQLQFPCVQAGLPEGCENFDLLPSIDAASKFFVATGMLRPPMEMLLKELRPRPSCIISDMCFPWTTELALELQIPRLVFHGMCCFSLLCTHNLVVSRILESIGSESEYFVVPGLPDRIELTMSQVPSSAKPSPPSHIKDIREQMKEAMKDTYGIVVNTFEELEPEYVQEYRKAIGKKAWCIGPVSLCNNNDLDKAERGNIDKNNSSLDEHQSLINWLDSCKSKSVIYACLGSLSRLSTLQMIELALGLEALNRPFVWIIRYKSDEFQNWLSEQKYEERNKEMAFLVHGWAPQVLILSHPAIGGFLTHCGWNSTLEGISAGVPMITWPFFAEQFCNEKLVVQVLRIGERVGIEVPVKFGEEEKFGVLVKKDDIKMVINKVMDEGIEGEERRKRAAKLGERAKKALEEGGSSDLNMELLIQDIIHQRKNC